MKFWPWRPPTESGLVIPGAPVERLIVSGALAVSAAFVAYNVTGKTPMTAGVPEIKPFTGFTLKPVGNPTAPKVIGRVPVAVIVYVNASPCRPLTNDGLVITGGTRTVSVAGELVIDPTGFVIATR